MKMSTGDRERELETDVRVLYVLKRRKETE